MKILISERQLNRLVEQTKDSVGQFLDNLTSIDKLTPQKKGFKYNSQVEMLQIALSFLGFGLPKYGIDGKFGPETLKSLNKFQKKYGMSITNIADKNTFTKLSTLIEKTTNKSNLESLIKGTFTTKPSNVNVYKKNISKEIVTHLTSKGLTPIQASGIAGNLYMESGFNTQILGDGGTSYGLAQWHNDRKNALFNWSKSKNLDVTKITTQLDFLWYELNTSYKKTLTLLTRSQTPSEAASVFAKYYEKPFSKDYSQRAGAAEDIYKYVSGVGEIKFY